MNLYHLLESSVASDTSEFEDQVLFDMQEQGCRKDEAQRSSEAYEHAQPSSSSSEGNTSYDFDEPNLLADQLGLLGLSGPDGDGITEKIEEIRSTPLFSTAVGKWGGSRPGVGFPQFALLAGLRQGIPLPHQGDDSDEKKKSLSDPRIFLNVNAPWSAFICGSQGSGKSHSLSCMLENCLLPHPSLGSLPNPLTALVFHYDSFTSMAGGQVCEAAYLCSSGLAVRVLVPPTNLAALTTLYSNMPGLPPDCARPTVYPFFFAERHLNARRLMTLMAAGSVDGPVPLYLQSVLQILREMALERQSESKIDYADFQLEIDYADFKRRILEKNLSANQLAPLNLRLELLESFLDFPKGPFLGGGSKKTKATGIDWTHAPGTITIVDLSCPFVDSDTACGLFELCLGVYLEQKMDIGRVIVLDEAHKVEYLIFLYAFPALLQYPSNLILTIARNPQQFMLPTSASAQKLTDSLVAVIRLQRHLACRIIIATQEPTISPKLLDLCSITLVHRFSSPDWMRELRGHLAAAAKTGDEEEIFETIVGLSVGEALLFAPSAMLELVGSDGLDDGDRNDERQMAKHEAEGHEDGDGDDDNDKTNDESTKASKLKTPDVQGPAPHKLGMRYAKIRIRDRLTVDGGRSLYAVPQAGD